MAEFLRPSVQVSENVSQPTTVNIPVSNGGFVGAAEKGPVDEATLVSSLRDYRNKFGGLFGGNYLPFAIQNYFGEGGRRAYVVRVTGSGAAKASATATDLQSSPGNALTIDALNEGAWGNQVGVDFIKFESEVATAVSDGATISSIELKKTLGLEIGDYLYVNDASTGDSFQRVVTEINAATNVVSFAPDYTTTATTGGISVDSPAVTASEHRARTSLPSNLSAATHSEVVVDNSANFRVGQAIIVGGASEYQEAVISAIEGNTIKFASSITTSGTISSANSYVISQEFIMHVYEDSSLVETHDFLSLSDDYKRDYIENRLKGDSNQSNVVEITDLGAGNLLENIPEPKKFSLSSGSDGSAVTDTEIIGDVSSSTGIYAFDAVDNINFFATPGFTSAAVNSANVSYAESRKDTIAILDMPLASDKLQEALEYKQSTLNKDSSYAAIYYPWLKANDPEASGQVVDLPPSGFVAGVYADVAVSRGVHKAPANEEITGAFDLTHRTLNGEHDVLNPAGINAIISKPGRGIRIMGARTLQSSKDGRHYVNVRRILNFIKVTLKNSLEQFLFEPNDASTRDRVRVLIDEFMFSIWRAGMLFPQNDRGAAYFVKLDNENNTPADVRAGIMNIDLFVSPSLPVEFIQLGINLSPGGVSVNELS